MSRVGLILGLAAAGYYGWQQGYFDGLMPTEASAAADAGQGEIVPISGENGTVTLTAATSKEERLLAENIDVVSVWAAQNLKWTAALMWQESRGNPSAIGPKTKWGRAYGSMQVLLGTAEQMHSYGYDDFPATKEALLTPRGGIYFGTAYLEYLSNISADREWITKAYHGGPHGEAKGMWGKKTHAYLDAIRARHKKLIETVEV